MADTPLPVHSLAEAHLYLNVTPCPACARGAEKLVQSEREGELMVIDVQCDACQATRTLRFALIEGHWPAEDEPGARRINATAEPSAIIDVAQWLTLFQVILDAASKTSDRQAARQLGYEAAQCLEEALKFYSLDSEDPPADAFFTPTTRQRLADHPEHFRRGRLIAMRHKLPTLRHMEEQIGEDAGTLADRPWWKFWRRRG